MNELFTNIDCHSVFPKTLTFEDLETLYDNMDRLVRYSSIYLPEVSPKIREISLALNALRDDVNRIQADYTYALNHMRRDRTYPYLCILL